MRRWTVLFAILSFGGAVGATEGSLSGGGLIAFPTGLGRTMWGLGAALDVRWAVDEENEQLLGVVVRGVLPPGLNVAFAWRWVLAEEEVVRPFFVSSTGVGFWLACVNGDLCGGGGLVISEGVGVSIWRFELLAEALWQTGMGNGVGSLVVPTLWAGTAF